jgi:iron complex transport system permease protein
MAETSIVCAFYFFANRWNYNALLNDGSVAGGLGVDVKRTRILGVVVSSLMAAAIESVAAVPFPDTAQMIYDYPLRF